MAAVKGVNGSRETHGTHNTELDWSFDAIRVLMLTDAARRISEEHVRICRCLGHGQGRG